MSSAANNSRITDHAFKPRKIYHSYTRPSEKESRLDHHQCGHVIDQQINSTVFGPAYCNQPPGAHLMVDLRESDQDLLKEN